jgi:hypothetical protein
LTHNALIVLDDGSYLELFAPTRPWIMTLLALIKRLGLLGRLTAKRSSIVRRFLEHVARGEGFADVALLTADLDGQLEAARERGLAMDEPLPGGRTRPDGREVRWRSGVAMAPDVPFLIEDLTPRQLRVPASGKGKHLNGVSGIAGIVIGVADLSQAAAHYRALLAPARDPESLAAISPSRAPEFSLGAVVLTLAAQDPGAEAGGAHSARASPPRFLLRLRTASKAAAGALDLQRTHNAVLELVAH